jgi:endonuclease III
MSKLSERMIKAREFEVTCGEVCLTCRRPTETEVVWLRSSVALLQGDTGLETLTQSLNLVCRSVLSWRPADESKRDVTEDMFMKGGDPTAVVAFDKDVLREWLADDIGLLNAVVTAINEQFLDFKRIKEDAEKN